MTQDQKDYIEGNANKIDCNTIANQLGIRYHAVWEYCNRHGIEMKKSPVAKRPKTKAVRHTAKEGYFNIDSFKNWLIGNEGQVLTLSRRV